MIALGGAIRFETICGIIPKDQIARFERMIFRVSRGNSLIIVEENYEESDPSFSDPKYKLIKKHIVILLFYYSIIFIKNK